MVDETTSPLRPPPPRRPGLGFGAKPPFAVGSVDAGLRVRGPARHVVDAGFRAHCGHVLGAFLIDLVQPGRRWLQRACSETTLNWRRFVVASSFVRRRDLTRQLEGRQTGQRSPSAFGPPPPLSRVASAPAVLPAAIARTAGGRHPGDTNCASAPHLHPHEALRSGAHGGKRRPPRYRHLPGAPGLGRAVRRTFRRCPPGRALIPFHRGPEHRRPSGAGRTAVRCRSRHSLSDGLPKSSASSPWRRRTVLATTCLLVRGGCQARSSTFNQSMPAVPTASRKTLGASASASLV